MKMTPPTNNHPRLTHRTLQALRGFFRLHSAGGIVLMLAAGSALALANSPWRGVYRHLRDLPALTWWVNDALMAVFFLLVALEIKREAVSGQLAGVQRMLLPVLCAIGGVVMPALVFFFINGSNATAMRGWAVPTATDIAFALGVLALLGTRAPLAMRLLLASIAIADDLIAIVIIAVFYSHDWSAPWLLAAVACVAAMWLLNRSGVGNVFVYLLAGVVLWYCVLHTGVHATLAGVITGLLIPLRSQSADMPPLEKLEHALRPWVTFAVLPLFAFVNAGLSLDASTTNHVFAPLPLGIALGLLLGKPAGIIGAAWLTRALGFTRLPDGMGNAALMGLGLLCGIGFTMSLFIAELAYGGLEYHFKASATLGILTGSLLSAVMGWLWLRLTLKPAVIANE